MIHTTYRTLIEKSGDWLNAKTFIAQVEKITGPHNDYGLDTPITLLDILKVTGVAQTIDALSKVTEGEKTKAISLCKKIVKVATHKACDLIGKKPCEFNWYTDFPQETRLAAYWAEGASANLKSMKDVEESGLENQISYYHFRAKNALTFLLRTARALRPSSQSEEEELAFMTDHLNTGLVETV